MNNRMYRLLPFLILALPEPVHAVCPLCTVAVAAGLGLSRWIGIDDAVTGIWIGGLILSGGLWMADWIRKKLFKIPYPEVLSILLMAVFVIPPLSWSKMIGIPGNTLWGIDKVIAGTLTGMTVFSLGVLTDKWLRLTNQGRVYVYYQKVIVPVFFLSVSSFVMYVLTK